MRAWGLIFIVLMALCLLGAGLSYSVGNYGWVAVNIVCFFVNLAMFIWNAAGDDE